VQARASRTSHFASNTLLLFFLHTAAQKVCLKTNQCLSFTSGYPATSRERETRGLASRTQGTLPFPSQRCRRLILVSKVTTKTTFVIPPSVILTLVCAISALRFPRQNYKLLLISIHHHESLPGRKQSTCTCPEGVNLRSFYQSSPKTHSSISLSKTLHKADSTRCINATKHTSWGRGLRAQILFPQIMLLVIIWTGTH